MGLSGARVVSVSARAAARSVAAAFACAVLAALAVLSVHSAKYALAGAAGVLCVGLAAADLSALPAVAVVGTLVVIRIGGSSTNLSISDALLFVATLSALPRVRVREDRVLRSLLGLVAVYEASVLVAVLYNPYRADFVEWVHEAFLAGGALVVGWVVGRDGRARSALSAFLVGSCVLSIYAALYSAAHHLHPANLPLGYQKNFVGDLVAFAILVAYANPSYLALRPRARHVVITICLLGLAGSQSRQAGIGLVVVALLLAHRNGGVLRRAKLLVALALPALAYIGLKVDEQLASSNRFNSVHQRLAWYHDSLTLFHLSPWLGEGLRWWYTGRFAFAFQPPNAELEILTSAGLLGLAGFLVAFGGSLERLRRLPPEVGTLAFAALLMRVVQGQFDIFWVASQASIPWMIVGIALGVAARQRARDALWSPAPGGLRTVALLPGGSR